MADVGAIVILAVEQWLLTYNRKHGSAELRESGATARLMHLFKMTGPRGFGVTTAEKPCAPAAPASVLAYNYFRRVQFCCT